MASNCNGALPELAKRLSTDFARSYCMIWLQWDLQS